MKNIFNPKQIKSFLIIGLIIAFCLVFLKWKKEHINQELQFSERPVIDLEHRLAFLPKTNLTYKYYRSCETNDWPLFVDEKTLFSLKYPQGSSFEIKQQEHYNSSLTESKTGLELIEYYRVELSKAFEEKLGGPYNFFFNIGVYKTIKILANEEYIKPFLTIRESKLMYPEEMKTWPFITCKPIDLENANAESCKVSYCYVTSSIFIR